MADIQEMSFQNVVDTILKPQGIKVGGYPDELFLDLTEKDREKWQCNICYLVLREPQQCDNKHKFCATCVFAWSMTYGANSDKCPVCRCKQLEYPRDRKLETEISMKWVKCPEKGCALRCPLRDFLQHSHGIKLYANQTADLNSLRRARPAPVNPMGNASIMFLPSLGAQGGSDVREGRNLLQDMMLVLHLEMELRRRAIDRFSTENNDAERVRHMSEVLAIQEQMQEITGFLNILFSIPPNQQAHRRRIGMNSFPGAGADDESSDSDSSDSSDSSGVVSRYRLAERQRLQQRSNAVVSSNQNTGGPNSTPSLNRARETGSVMRAPSAHRLTRPSEIREELGRIQNGDTQTLELSRPALSVASQNQTPSVVTTQRTAPNVASQTRPSLISQRSISERATIDSSSNALLTATSNNTRNSGTVEVQTDRQASLIPRSSSTFQSAMEQLPPISRPSSIVEDSDADNGESNRQARPSVPSSSSAQPGVPAAHRRPAPPAGPGPTVNTTRARRRSNTNPGNTNTGSLRNSNTMGGSSSTSNATGNATSNATGNATSNTESAGSTTSTLAQRGGTRTVRNHARGRSDSTVPTTPGRSGSNLPTTSGALLRARRRSEIQQQIQRNLSNNDADETGS